MKYSRSGNKKKFKIKKIIKLSTPSPKKSPKILSSVPVPYVTKQILDLKEKQEIKAECWLTPQAIEFLKNYIPSLTHGKVLEYGSGGSTLWLSQFNNIAHVDSIEHDKKWSEVVRYNLKLKNISKVNVHNLERPYYDFCKDKKEIYDFILVDGRDRVECFKNSIPSLKRGGVIMLDNSERERYREIFDITISLGWKSHKTFLRWETTWWFKK